MREIASRRDPDESSTGRRPGDPLLRPATRRAHRHGPARSAPGRHPLPAALGRAAGGVGRHRLAPAVPHVPAARRPVPAVPVQPRPAPPRSRRATTRSSSSRTGSRRWPPGSNGTCRRTRPGTRWPSCGPASAGARSSASPASTTASSPSSARERARLVVDVWAERTAELSGLEGVEQVFCFENHGEEIGVTLSHPHGQIYAYPFVAPRVEKVLASVPPAPGGDRRRPVRRGGRRRAVRAAGRRRQRALDGVRPGRRPLALRGAAVPGPQGAGPAGADRRGARRLRRGLPGRAGPVRPPLRHPDALHRRRGTRRRCTTAGRTGGCTCSCSRCAAPRAR